MPGRQPKFNSSGSRRQQLPSVSRQSITKGRSVVSDYKRTNPTEWDCKYHIIFMPKYRKKVLSGKLRDRLGAVCLPLAQRKECDVEEGHLMGDHVHIMIAMPPK